MHTYSVEIRWNGKNFAPVIQANSAADSIAVVKMQYPGCSVFRATKIG